MAATKALVRSTETDARPLRLRERAIPAPLVGECLLRVRAALVVAADRTTGPAGPTAAERVPGQAFVGVVEKLGPSDGDLPSSVKSLVGKRVAVHPVVRCGRCDRCLGGLSQHCRDRAILGLDRDGGWAEHAVVPIASCVALPDSLDDERAAFAVPVARALEAMRHVRVEGKTYITVLGDDAEALATTQMMTRLNAAVRILARSESTITLAEKLGVKHRRADEVGRRGDQDVVVDCIGGAESLAFAAALVRARGTVILLGTGSDGSEGRTADLASIVLGELRVQGSFHGPLAEAVELLAKRALDPSPLIERRLSLDAAAGREPAVGTLLRS
jgi:threonine dehydrogenase-like Zn-dependent dehydrogenase